MGKAPSVKHQLLLCRILISQQRTTWAKVRTLYHGDDKQTARILLYFQSKGYIQKTSRGRYEVANLKNLSTHSARLIDESLKRQGRQIMSNFEAVPESFHHVPEDIIMKYTHPDDLEWTPERIYEVTKETGNKVGPEWFWKTVLERLGGKLFYQYDFGKWYAGILKETESAPDKHLLREIRLADEEKMKKAEVALKNLRFLGQQNDIKKGRRWERFDD